DPSMKKNHPDAQVDMTPMIDVVFQLIIFFVVTADMANKAMDTRVRMAMSPNGPVEEQKDPRTVVVDVERDGKIALMKTHLSEGQLYTVLRNAVNTSGQGTPIVIRGDHMAKHEDIKRVMDIAGKAGLWKIRFAALKEMAD
ncbi:MAG: biopolymer transporter ExbD, partial [Kiritimatiellae bacterium]|nr:biopolymer transporter ExbD [Kiritimatiellia bacterium]